MSSSKSILVLTFGILISMSVCAQHMAFGVKGGPTLGTQKWNSAQGNDPLFSYHIMAFVETEDEGSSGSLFAETGYHVKGRAFRLRATVNPNTGITYEAQTLKLKFNNASLLLGARNRFLVGNTTAFYSIALRGEYNVSHDLQLYRGYEDGIQKFVYGLSFGGGFDFPFSELVGGVIDFRVSPDISRQIFIPASQYNNPFTGTEETFREQSVKNIALEVSLGIRFLRKVIYVD
ncbi:MAG: hypothetical protein HKN87_07800 [Saprospiraceae bacterium]|nr:hypothetical protein [Saprospiraceae bacterium]